MYNDNLSVFLVLGMYNGGTYLLAYVSILMILIWFWTPLGWTELEKCIFMNELSYYARGYMACWHGCVLGPFQMHLVSDCTHWLHRSLRESFKIKWLRLFSPFSLLWYVPENCIPSEKREKWAILIPSTFVVAAVCPKLAQQPVVILEQKRRRRRKITGNKRNRKETRLKHVHDHWQQKI